jgi:nucleotide-binding universal stress UspA family protein
VTDEKPLGDGDLAEDLAVALKGRGYNATALRITLGGRKIAEALQDTARKEGAGLLAMGGFGHSRFRDFVLGGATLGVLSQLSVPVLLSH